MRSAISILLFRIGEGPHPFEARPFDELEQLLEVLVRLARVSHHQCGTNMYARHPLAQRTYKIDGLLPGEMAPHVLQHMVGHMLQCDIQIPAHIRFFSHHLEEVIRELRRISIMQPYPLHARYIGHARDELCYLAVSVDIDAVVSQFLCYDLELPHPLCHEAPHLLQDILLRSAHMPARDDRYCAVGTMAVASLADFEVSVMRRCGDEPHAAAGRDFRLSKVGKQLFVVELSVILIHLGYFLFQFRSVAL